MVNSDEKKRLEIRFSDGSDINIFLRLEGSRLDKYGVTLTNLLPLMLSNGALHQDLLPMPSEKMSNGDEVFEILQKQGETLNNVLKVIREFRNIDFSSKDVKKRYEERLGKPIQLSTIATYLLRLHDKGLLLRRKRGREYVYQAAAILLKNE